MSEKPNPTVEKVDHEKLKNILAGKNDGNIQKKPELLNENNDPIGDLVNPLTFSLDSKNHPDMVAVPAAIKFSRDFKKLYDEVRKLPS